jgi:hypothetical protein
LNRIRLKEFVPSRIAYIFGGSKFFTMANRKGVFIGAYVPLELKESLQRRATSEHRTLSQEITRILTEAVHGKGLPAGSIDRRGNNSAPRRRATDPLPRRRAGDLPYVETDDTKK